MFYKIVGLLFLWGTILFTVMQKNDVIWLVSAVVSIVLMHFVAKWVKLGGLSQLGLGVKKGWFRYLLLGNLIDIGLDERTSPNSSISRLRSIRSRSFMRIVQLDLTFSTDWDENDGKEAVTKPLLPTIKNRV